MTSVKELREFLKRVHDDTNIAIDDGGLTLVLCTADGEETGSYIEVGGLPDKESRNDAEVRS